MATTTTEADKVTLTLSRAAFREVIDSAIKLNDRRDQLLDLNGEDELDESGRDELESLVGIAQICMLLEMAAERNEKR